jgi:hypothetical protein
LPLALPTSRGLVGLLIAAVCAAVPAAASAGQATVTISAPGETAFKVPEGVSSVQFEATGARGGSDGYGLRGGGLGGRAFGTASPVNPGRIFYVEVGIGGGSGWVFGGAGGGASDLRTCSAAVVGSGCAGNLTSLATRLLVGAGGGGAGALGGNGGAAGVAGEDGTHVYAYGQGGSPGTASAGGAGGAGSSSGGGAGSAGVLGAGGSGAGAGGGGGGGGGLYGGGGGGGASTANEGPGGGGGGSSFVDTTSLLATGSGAAQQDAPKMVISYQESVAPSLSIAAPSDGSRRQPTPVVSGTAGITSGDAATVTVRVYSGAAASGTPVRSIVTDVNPLNGAWSTQVTDPLPDGQYTLRAEQSDAAQNTGISTPVTISVDGTAPGLALSSPGAATADQAAPIAGTAGIASGDPASVDLTIFSGSTATGSPVESLGATPVLPGGAFSATPSPALAEGTYTARATQTDDVGNQATATRTFIVDTTAPTVAVGTPADGATYAEGATMPADFSCADGGSGVATCDAPVAAGTAVDTATLGAHAFTVTAHDNAGNAATRSVSYTVSAAAPSATTGGASGVSASAATLAGSVVPHAGGATASVEYGTSTAYGKSVSAGSLPPGGAATPVSAKATGLKPGVTYHYRVVATNGGGIGAGADRTVTTPRLAAGLKLRSVRVQGAFVVIAGSAASGVTGTVKATARRTGHSTKGQAKLKRGKFTLRVPIPRGSGRVALTVSYAGDARHRKATAKRRVQAGAR